MGPDTTQSGPFRLFEATNGDKSLPRCEWLGPSRRTQHKNIPCLGHLLDHTTKQKRPRNRRLRHESIHFGEERIARSRRGVENGGGKGTYRVGSSPSEQAKQTFVCKFGTSRKVIILLVREQTGTGQYRMRKGLMRGSGTSRISTRGSVPTLQKIIVFKEKPKLLQRCRHPKA